MSRTSVSSELFLFRVNHHANNLREGKKAFKERKEKLILQGLIDWRQEAIVSRDKATQLKVSNTKEIMLDR